jgi:uncharacterized membrane protein YccC
VTRKTLRPGLRIRSGGFGPRSGADKPSSRAVRYAVETISTTVILVWGFRVTGWPGAVWAIITAILVLHPGLDRSLRASRVRIVATLLGASIGIVSGVLLGGSTLALLVGIVATILTCYQWRLSRHLRQACLTVPIVQMSQQGTVVHIGYERVIAVLAGCVVPLLVQYVWQFALGRCQFVARFPQVSARFSAGK